EIRVFRRRDPRGEDGPVLGLAGKLGSVAVEETGRDGLAFGVRDNGRTLRGGGFRGDFLRGFDRLLGRLPGHFSNRLELGRRLIRPLGDLAARYHFPDARRAFVIPAGVLRLRGREKRGHAPEVGLLERGVEHVIVALTALELYAEE